MQQSFTIWANKFFTLFSSSKPSDESAHRQRRATLQALEERWRTEMNTFQVTHNPMHLQAAGEALYQALNQTHGEHAATIAFQAGGWPRPWEQSFSFPPPNGEVSDHDAILHSMLKDIGEALSSWGDIPKCDVLALIDQILIRRNRRNSQFRPFGKDADSGHWPHDNTDNDQRI